MTTRKSREIAFCDSDRDAIMEALKAYITETPDVNQLREVVELLITLDDKISDLPPQLRFAELMCAFSDIQPRVSRLRGFVKVLNSVLAIMPHPIPLSHPWAQDVATLRGDMATIGGDAWNVIARHENERIRQES